jgi:hypothetical protein
MVLASAPDENGEQLYLRTWNHDFIDLAEIRNQRQPTFSEDVMKIIAANSDPAPKTAGRVENLHDLIVWCQHRLSDRSGPTLGRFPRIQSNV